ncbi:MAG: AAA family ATPase [Rhodocyclaceae bacterium]|jgi:MSHA biogenesis protein MshM|nr:AAA family ATPase [Rhodocyclaceae bacterium]MBK6906725.1 AAA family ATPase [Rhodocyclaceae bacterium]
MYLDHFGLYEAPFRITPDTDFFFGGGNRGATLDALIYAITHDEGIVKVSGEVGSGKTMLCRVLMDRLPQTVTIIYLANPSLSREDILFAIAHELRLEIAPDARAAVVLRSLQDHLIKSYGEGRQVVVLIDEAHAMPTETLEEIRLLSNLESNRNKLLQLVLFGQPELNEVLARPNMRQLKERVTHNFSLEPLVRDDIASYLDFRLRAAGYKGPSPFDTKAIKTIAKISQGLTRRVNILADKCLLAAFSSGRHHIGKSELRAAVRDCDFSTATMSSGGSGTATKTRQWATIALAALLGAAVMAWFFDQRPTVLSEQPAVVPPAPSQSIAPQQPIAPPQPTAPMAISSQPIASEPPPTPAATPTAEAPQISPTSASSSQAQKAAPDAQDRASEELGQLTKLSLAAGIRWLEEADNSSWFLQLLASDGTQPDAVEAFLRRAKTVGLDLTKVRVYRAYIKDQTRLGVIYGDYETRSAASSDLKKLPNAIKGARPFPRQVKQLRE